MCFWPFWGCVYTARCARPAALPAAAAAANVAAARRRGKAAALATPQPPPAKRRQSHPEFFPPCTLFRLSFSKKYGKQEGPAKANAFAGPSFLLCFDGAFSSRRRLSRAQRICPLPKITCLVDVSVKTPMGPLACSFWVEMPISAPRPSSPPSVNRVEALT